MTPFEFYSNYFTLICLSHKLNEKVFSAYQTEEEFDMTEVIIVFIIF